MRVTSSRLEHFGHVPTMAAMGYQTAAILVIGNEILSGRTREANAWLAAQRLFARGCRLTEIAVVPDHLDTIVASLNRLRSAYDAIITSGGIGPTHDDITMDAVAQAFGVPLHEHAETIARMQDFYGHEPLNSGRRRMARLPAGAEPILCEQSIAPGAHIGNVYVLAGVPHIFASQLDTILPAFGDRPFHRVEIETNLPESRFARALSDVQDAFPDVEIGSYPKRCGAHPSGKICLSSTDRARLHQAAERVHQMLAAISSKPSSQL